MKKWMRIAAATAVSLAMVGAAYASGGGHGEAVAGGWKPTDTYRVMNFVVLAAGLFFILRKPVANFLSGRISEIEAQLAELDARKAETEKSLSEYRRKLKAMDAEAEEILATYRKQGEEAKARILAEAEVAAEKIRAQAKKNIEHEFARVKAELQAEVMDKALDKAEVLIREKISGEDQERLVGEYIEKVVA